MRWGFDVDGVFADFIPAYNQLVIGISGKNLMHPEDWTDPPCWNWPEYRGYSEETMNEVWRVIKESHAFWFNLQPTQHMSTLALLLPDLEHKHDVYYVTHRMGLGAKRQTEAFFRKFLPYTQLGLHPTVTLCGDKGAAAKALQLDVYIDDNLDNIKSVLTQSPKTRAYLLNAAYNQGDVKVIVPVAPIDIAYPSGLVTTGEVKFETRIGIRVPTVGAMFDAEILNL